MFCDLVGSTALSTRHDPEDLRELIGDLYLGLSTGVADRRALAHCRPGGSAAILRRRAKLTPEQRKAEMPKRF